MQMQHAETRRYITLSRSSSSASAQAATICLCIQTDAIAIRGRLFQVRNIEN